MSISIGSSTSAIDWQQTSTTQGTQRKHHHHGGGTPPAPPTGDILDISSDMLKKLDGNGDGSIDLASEVNGPEAGFLKDADTDGDGQVTSDELRAKLSTIDTDGDGKLNASEWQADIAKHGGGHGGPPPTAPTANGAAGDDSGNDPDSSTALTVNRDLLAELMQQLNAA